MVIRNKKLIGLIALVVGLAVVLFWGNILYKISSLPFTGITTQAKVIGYKSNHGYGVRMIESPNSFLAAKKSPFFSFLSAKGDTIKTYSNAPQIFILITYNVGDEIKIAYPINKPEKAVIVNWKEFPGLILMLAFGFLMMVVGKSYLLKKA